LLLLLSSHASAADLALLAGRTESPDTGGKTFGWEIEARYDLESPFSFSAGWVNEGHFRDHRRDGPILQLFGRAPLLERRLSLAFGAGIYRYFDTQTRPGEGTLNVHGWAPLYTLSATWSMKTPWFLRLSLNHVKPAGEIDTNALLLGLGYRFPGNDGETSREPAPGSGGRSPGKRVAGVSLLLGETVHNGLGNRSGIAGGIEFRRGISGPFDFTLSLLGENNRKEIRRAGLGSQVWVMDEFLDRRLEFGIGAGLYTFLDATPPAGGGTRLDLAGLLTLTAGWRFADRWIVRFHWNRVATDNHRDSDIFLLGIGLLLPGIPSP